MENKKQFHGNEKWKHGKCTVMSFEIPYSFLSLN